MRALLVSMLLFGLGGASTEARAQDLGAAEPPPKLGFNAVRVAGGKAQRFGVPTGEGLKITYLLPGCPAASVLQKGDIIYRVGTWNVGNLAQSNKALQAQYARGQLADVELVRNGQAMRVQAQVSDGWKDCQAGAKGIALPVVPGGPAAEGGAEARAVAAEGAAMRAMGAKVPPAEPAAPVGRPYIGVGPAPKIGFNANTVLPPKARRMEVPTGRGIEITSLIPGCPAADVLRVGDIVYRIGNHDIGTIEESNAMLRAQYSRGDMAAVQVVRNGRLVPLSVPVVADGWADCDESASPEFQALLADDLSEEQAMLAERRAMMAEYKRAMAGKGGAAAPSASGGQKLRLGIWMDGHELGVVVTEVEPGTPAQEAGVQAGDVVMTFDGTRPDSIAHAQKLVAAADRDVDLMVMRGSSVLTLKAMLQGGGDAPVARAAPAPSSAAAQREVDMLLPALDERQVRELEAELGPERARIAAEEFEKMRALLVAVESGTGGPREMEQLEQITVRMEALQAEARAEAAGGASTAAAPPPPATPPPAAAPPAVPSAAPEPPAVAPSPEAPPAAVAAAPSPGSHSAASTPMAVAAASPLVPVGGSGGAQALNYSCSSGRAGTVNVPAGQCQSDRNNYAKAVACGERSEVKRTCEALYTCLGRSVADYCPF